MSKSLCRSKPLTITVRKEPVISGILTLSSELLWRCQALFIIRKSTKVFRRKEQKVCHQYRQLIRTTQGSRFTTPIIKWQSRQLKIQLTWSHRRRLRRFCSVSILPEDNWFRAVWACYPVLNPPASPQTKIVCSISGWTVPLSRTFR